MPSGGRRGTEKGVYKCVLKIAGEEGKESCETKQVYVWLEAGTERGSIRSNMYGQMTGKTMSGSS